jgi:hypothetical protein
MGGQESKGAVEESVGSYMPGMYHQEGARDENNNQQFG